MSKVVIKNRDVRVEAAGAGRSDRPRVELLEEEGIVRAIRLRCRCGDDTVVELEYPTPDAPRAERKS